MCLTSYQHLTFTLTFVLLEVMELRIQLTKPSVVKHQSLAHDAILLTATNQRATELEEAVDYCKTHGCRGQKAISSGLFPTIGCPKTINRRLDGDVKTGEEKRYCSLLTAQEEASLVRYIKNRSRCLQGMNDRQVEEVVLRILSTREAINKQGGRKFQKMSHAAKSALNKKKVSRSFFLTLRSKYPELKKKVPKKVDINRGFNVTEEMAIEYLDDLAAEINEAGIGRLEYAGPGVWNGPIDARRILFHDETPQMINHGDSSYTTTKVFGVSAERCETLIKSNRECVTVQPFSNLAGETLCTQVIFSGGGLTSHMAPEATSNIPNLLVSVNKSGVTDHETLLSAYQELDRELMEKDIPCPVIIIADGHSSRFDEAVLEFLKVALLLLFILHPDTSGGTQVHDQMNAKLHALYDEKKALLYSTVSTLNRESFMIILSEAWPEFATPSILINAARRVGLSSDGLNLNWMNQEMFKRADYLLNGPATPEKSSSANAVVNNTVICSPVGVRRNTMEYYKQKYETANKKLQALMDTSIALEDVDGMLPAKKIQPKKSKLVRLTQVRGSMRAANILEKVKERNAVEAEKLQKKTAAATTREKMRLAFILCNETCQCNTPECIITGLKQCPVCLNVLKSSCSKSSCMIDGKKPVMIVAPSARPSAISKPPPVRQAKQRASKKFKEMVNSVEDTDLEDEEVFSDDNSTDISSESSDIEDFVFEDGKPRPFVCEDPKPILDEGDFEIGESSSDDQLIRKPLLSVLEGDWVKVIYEGAIFIGKVSPVKVSGKQKQEFVRVRCLRKPYGIREPQDLETEEEAADYREVYECKEEPQMVQVARRKWQWSY